jgi:hypothetical protein
MGCFFGKGEKHQPPVSEIPVGKFEIGGDEEKETATEEKSDVLIIQKEEARVEQKKQNQSEKLILLNLPISIWWNIFRFVSLIDFLNMEKVTISVDYNI